MPAFTMILKRLPFRLLWACLLVAFLSALPLGAAEIIEAEYYLGNDPGEGNGDALNHLEP